MTPRPTGRLETVAVGFILAATALAFLFGLDRALTQSGV